MTNDPGKLTEDQLRELGREAERERFIDRLHNEDFGKTEEGKL